MISGLLKEWKDLSRKLKPETLYHWHHRLIVKRLAECADPGPYTLYAALRRTGECREWDNLPAWIAEVWELDPTGCSFEYHAKIVADCWRLRSLAHVADEIIRDATHPWGSVAEVVQESLRKLMSI